MEVSGRLWGASALCRRHWHAQSASALGWGVGSGEWGGPQEEGWQAEAHSPQGRAGVLCSPAPRGGPPLGLALGASQDHFHTVARGELALSFTPSGSQMVGEAIRLWEMW